MIFRSFFVFWVIFGQQLKDRWVSMRENSQIHLESFQSEVFPGRPGRRFACELYIMAAAKESSMDVCSSGSVIRTGWHFPARKKNSGT